MNTRILLALVPAALVAACAMDQPTRTASVAPAPGAVVAPPGAVVAVPPGTAVTTPASTVAAIPIGSPKFGVTADCNASSGGTVQGRTSATTMLDCGPVTASK